MQSRYLRKCLQERCKEYRTDTITVNIGNSKTLWLKVSRLLNEVSTVAATRHTADDFAAYFRDKVSKIRQSTLAAPTAVVEHRSADTLSMFRPVTTAEISKIVKNSPAKQCGLDPAPTVARKTVLQTADSVNRQHV